MKTRILAIFIGFLMVACSNNNKQAKLDELLKQQDELSLKIEQLQKEVGAEKGIDLNKKVIEVQAIDVKIAPFNHYIEVQGKVDGEENVGVSAQTMGLVSKILVKEGDAVRKDQVLAELDAQVLLQSLQQLKSTQSFVNNLYEKQKSLWDQKIGSEVQYLTAKNNKENTDNGVKTLLEQIEMTKIKSPINGTVEDIPIKIGQAVSPGLPIFRVINFSRAKITAEVSESFSSKVKKGNNVLITLPDFNKEIDAKIDFTSKYINPINRTFLIESIITANDVEYRANMYAVVKINDYNSENAITLPVNLVQSDSKGKFVYVVSTENGKTSAKKQIVKTGLNYNGIIEITEGLKAGDKVISTGVEELEDGELIKL